MNGSLYLERRGVMSVSKLDIATLVSELDTEDMLGYLRNFPDDLANQWSIEEPQRDMPERVICLGMGGSAAAGDFLASLACMHGTAAVTTHRGYDVPSWGGAAGAGLYFSTSYSGNTEETLSATILAMEHGNFVNMISSGGTLAEMDGQESPLGGKGQHVSVPGGQPPRSAFGHLFGALSRIAYSYQIIPALMNWVENGLVERLRQVVSEYDFINNPYSPAISIARTLIGREVGIVSDHNLACAGTRFTNQLNENGGIFARPTTLPEMNHNEIIAWTQPEAKEKQALLLLTWDGMHERVAERVNWMTEAVDVDVVWNLHCEGESLLEAMLYSCIAMDWISCAVAFLRGKDPSSIGAIRELKEHLNKSPIDLIELMFDD